MNSVCLIGRIATELELKVANSGIKLCKFTLACGAGKNKQGEETTAFIPVTVFNRQAEVLCNYKQKGSQIAVVGYIQTGSYTDKDGRKVYTTDVIANNIEFIGKKEDEPSNNDEPRFAEIDEDIPW